jgi:hypothetical protein
MSQSQQLHWWQIFCLVQDLLCCPRPLQSQAPKDQLERLAALVGPGEVVYNREYGLPSTHTSMSLAYFLTLTGLLHMSGLLSPTAAAVTVAASMFWGLWIALGRMYAAMHSLTDVLAGAALCAFTLPAFLLSAPFVLHWANTASWVSIAALSLGSCLVYPKPLRDTPSFWDAVAFVGAATGAVLGMQYGGPETPQVPLDVQNSEHLQLTALQILSGLLLTALGKEAASTMSKPVMRQLLARLPQALRSSLLPPVHGHVPENVAKIANLVCTLLALDI